MSSGFVITLTVGHIARHRQLWCDKSIRTFAALRELSKTGSERNFAYLFATRFCDSQAVEIAGVEKPLQKPSFLQQSNVGSADKVPMSSTTDV
jgi:hypothetical protein